MTLWLAFRRLLPLLAVLSLALTPVAAPAATATMHAAMVHHDGAPVDNVHTGMTGMDMAGMDMTGMDMDAMPCCPRDDGAGIPGGAHGSTPQDPSKPACAKGCPLMALCLASAASLLPAALPMPVPVARRASLSWPDPASLGSVQGAPFPEPPRA